VLVAGRLICRKKKESEGLWRAEGKMIGGVAVGQLLRTTQPLAHFPLLRDREKTEAR